MEITVQDLKNKFNLTLTDDETGIYVYPMNRYCFTSFPLPKDLSECLVVNKDEYLGMLSGLLMFNDDLNTVVPLIDPQESEYEQLDALANQKMQHLSEKIEAERASEETI